MGATIVYEPKTQTYAVTKGRFVPGRPYVWTVAVSYTLDGSRCKLTVGTRKKVWVTELSGIISAELRAETGQVDNIGWTAISR